MVMVMTKMVEGIGSRGIGVRGVRFEGMSCTGGIGAGDSDSVLGCLCLPRCRATRRPRWRCTPAEWIGLRGTGGPARVPSPPAPRGHPGTRAALCAASSARWTMNHKSARTAAMKRKWTGGRETTVSDVMCIVGKIGRARLGINF